MKDEEEEEAVDVARLIKEQAEQDEWLDAFEADAEKKLSKDRETREESSARRAYVETIAESTRRALNTFEAEATRRHQKNTRHPSVLNISLTCVENIAMKASGSDQFECRLTFCEAGTKAKLLSGSVLAKSRSIRFHKSEIIRKCDLDTSLQFLNQKIVSLRNRVANVRLERAEMLSEVQRIQSRTRALQRQLDGMNRSSTDGFNLHAVAGVRADELLLCSRLIDVASLDASQETNPSSLLRCRRIRAEIEANMSKIDKEAYEDMMRRYNELSRALDDVESARATLSVCVARAEAQSLWREMKSQGGCRDAANAEENRKRDEVESSLRKAKIELVQVKQNRERFSRIHASNMRHAKKEEDDVRSKIADVEANLATLEGENAAMESKLRAHEREDETSLLEEHIRRLRLLLRGQI
eukprot:g2334.t1